MCDAEASPPALRLSFTLYHSLLLSIDTEHILCIQPFLSLYSLHELSIHSMYAALVSLSIYSMYTALVLSIRSLFTLSSLSSPLALCRVCPLLNA